MPKTIALVGREFSDPQYRNLNLTSSCGFNKIEFLKLLS